MYSMYMHPPSHLEFQPRRDGVHRDIVPKMRAVNAMRLFLYRHRELLQRLGVESTLAEDLREFAC